MIIDATPVGLTPDSPVLQTNLRVVLTLQLITMTGVPHYVKYDDEFNRLCNLPKPETLSELVALIFRRKHPVLEYIAEQNGVIVTEYVERETFSQAMKAICYKIDNTTGRTILRL